MTNAECRNRFDGVVTSGIADHMICASYPGKDTCTVGKRFYKTVNSNLTYQVMLSFSMDM